MPDFIRWLLNEPIVLLILIGWIFSMIGGVVQKAARKAQQERTREAQAGRQRSRDATARPASRGPDPQEIAREIRRAMGLERETPASRPAPTPSPQVRDAKGIGGESAPRRVDYDELPRPEPTSFDERPTLPTMARDEAHPRRGGLREEMAERDTKSRELGWLAARDAHLGADVRARRLDLHVRSGRRAEARKARHPARGLLNLSRPAAAIVAMEVLGRPIAMRGSPYPHDV